MSQPDDNFWINRTKADGVPCPACDAPLPLACTRPDPCIGYLPGVYNACCGHGNDDFAYISFGQDDAEARAHEAIRGCEALRIMRSIRNALGALSDEGWHGGHDDYDPEYL